MCQHKVAFLNLSLNSFNHRIIWNSFFEQGDKDIFNLYIHSKDKKCFLFKDYFIKNTVPTKWGHFSLVEATIELMKTALKDEQEGIKGFKFNEYNAVCQFFVFRREDAIKFIETFDHWSQYFVKNKVIFADEFYFWGIAKELGMNFNMGQASTYSDWRIKRLPNGSVERTPRTFNTFNSFLLQKLRGEGFLYARKAMPKTLVTTKLF
jgi:hypothetical protein